MGNNSSSSCQNTSHEDVIKNTTTHLVNSGVSENSCVVNSLNKINSLSGGGGGSGSGSGSGFDWAAWWKEIETQILKEKWDKDKNLYNELPDRIKEDEKNYYLEADSEEYYRDDILKVRYREIFQKFKNNKVKQLDEIKDNVDKDLENYRSEKIAEARMEQLYRESLKTNEALKRDIDNFYKKLITDERKVYYEDQQLDNVEYYKKFIMILYYSLLALYVVIGPFIWEKKYMSILVWVLIVLYVVFPFILKYLIDYVSEFIGERKAVKHMRKTEYYVIEKKKKKKKEENKNE